MYSVLLVDDEPGALVMMRSIIEKKCNDFYVAATAENGVDALEKMKEIHPDIVITDVQMPLMNGIELVMKIREQYPETFSIIVSGYQEFEYAKAALQAGVCNYILKPIVPSTVQKTLDELADKLNEIFYQERKKIIYSLCSGGILEDAKAKKYFGYERYYVAIIRRNGLPRRFSTDKKIEIYSDIHEQMTIYGRDEMEALYVVPEEILFGQTFEEYILKVQGRETCNHQYVTCIYFGHSITTDELLTHIKELYRALDTVCTVGFNQSLDMDKSQIPKEIEFDYACINYLLGCFENLIKTNQIVKLKENLLSLYRQWRDEKKPQLWLEQVSRQIITVIYKNYQHAAPLIEYEYMQEDAFFFSSSMEELIDTLMEIMFRYVEEPQVQKKVDSPEFFEKIEKYIDEHMAENISLQSICKYFGVSQTYLSKLFRKYAEESFNQYLTEMRMKRAAELLNQNREFFVKDIAELVGYTDQFYFSRIFRSYTGKSPSDYIKSMD